MILFTLQLNLSGVRNYVALSKKIFQEDKLKFRFPVFPGAADTLSIPVFDVHSLLTLTCS